MFVSWIELFCCLKCSSKLHKNTSYKFSITIDSSEYIIGFEPLENVFEWSFKLNLLFNYESIDIFFSESDGLLNIYSL